MCLYCVGKMPKGGHLMEYITSRGRNYPIDPIEMREQPWYNTFRRKLWPYEELLVGDTIYWYESPSKQIVWKSRVSEVGRFQYPDKRSLKTWLESKPNKPDTSGPYWDNTPDHGYCLFFTVDEPQTRITIPKPAGYGFPRPGWLRVNIETAKTWGIATSGDDDLTLDDVAPFGSLYDKLLELNRKMVEVSPTRVETVVKQTIRRDTGMVMALKELCDFRCQFPGCGVRIPKRGGGFYVEVAHIEPVSKGGRSVIGNLVVLCPNHHKEMDCGTLEITVQTTDRVSGRVNGKDFEIGFPGLPTVP